MKFLKIAFKRETFAPMLALVFASFVCFVLVVARVIWTEQLRYAFLIWNLFLAWLPLVFALLACEQTKQSRPPTWRLAAWAGAWFLFFPNAPYIFTDLIHLKTRFFNHFWVDLTLILTCAITGLIIGFVSLYLMQSVARRMFGQVASWIFIIGITGLSSLGVCIGRFLRFNSWDIFLKPTKLVQDLGLWAESFSHPASLAFPILFSAFLFTAYLMLYALTHLSQIPTEEK
jgi:uncharacterized membrane protein